MLKLLEINYALRITPTAPNNVSALNVGFKVEFGM